VSSEEEPRERPRPTARTVHPDETAAERARAPQNQPDTIPGLWHSEGDAEAETPAEPEAPKKPAAGRKRQVIKK
jgi:hypothetical protein